MRARDTLETFVELAEQEASFLRPYIVQITTAMFHIALARQQLEPATRQFGLEFLVTLTEAKAPLVKKIPNFLTTLVPLLLNMMLDIPVRRIALAPFVCDTCAAAVFAVCMYVFVNVCDRISTSD